MAIFTHVTVGTNDLTRARTFYDKVLGALGYKRLTDSARTARSRASPRRSSSC